MTGPSAGGLGGIEQEILAIGALISSAREKLSGGELIDISALDGCVTSLCNRLERQGGEDSDGLRPAVLSLIEDFTLLAELIEARLAGLRKNLHKEPEPAQAISAYRQAAGPDEPKR